jgi:hypothetical protein
METRNRWSKQLEGKGHGMTRQFFSAVALTTALLIASVGANWAQQAPEPPEPPEAPAPPQPPEAPDTEQLFLLNDGTAHLGVTLRDVTAQKAQQLKLAAVAGAIVSTVQPDSAAAKAGIKVGDVITEFDAVRVRSGAELRRLIRETPVGRTVAIKIVRDGKTSVLSAKLEASSNRLNFYGPETRIPAINMPEMRIQPPLGFSEGPFAFAFPSATLGISADNLTPQLAQYFGVKQGKGVLVSEVTTGGAADKAGLKAGDVIVEVDGKPVTDVEELRSALNDKFTDDTRKVSLTIVRDHHEQTVNAELTRSQSWEKRTSNAAGADYAQALTQLKAQLDQERTLVKNEVLKQKEYLDKAWQAQMRDQMLTLQKQMKDKMNQLQNLRITLRNDGEI